MKIGFIIYGPLDQITGGYIYNKYLVNYLEQRGVTVKIFSQPNKNIFTLLKNNVARDLIQQIIAFSPDLLLEDALNFASLCFFNPRLKKKINIPIISLVHVAPSCISKNQLFKWFITKIEGLFFRSIDGFIYASLATKNAVSGHLGQKAIKNIIARPGKDHLTLPHITRETIIQRISTGQRRRKENTSLRKLNILFIGNLNFNKGLHVLIAALANIDLELWHLVVIGSLDQDKKYLTKLQKFISRQQLTSNIQFLGKLDSQQVAAQVITHDILAVPSYYESFGMVYAEAMAAGLPVIACQTGGAKEIVTHEKNGFLIPAGNSQIMSEYILRWIYDEKLLLDMSLSALINYNNLTSWMETLTHIEHFLNTHIYSSTQN